MDTFTYYISAAGDLKTERELLSQIPTEIPISLAWQIVQTPLRGEPISIESISKADFHLVFLGRDIQAPVGYEWLVSQRAGRKPKLFKKEKIMRTLAAQAFLRDVAEGGFTWYSYQDLNDLHFQICLLLADSILKHARYYKLSDKEFEQLKSWKEGLEKKEVKKFNDEMPGGTGESAVILSRERYIPKNGVILKSSEEIKSNSRDIDELD